VRKLAEAGAEARNWTLSRYVESLVQADEVAREHLIRKGEQIEADLEQAS
jgi:hypothetical protein